MTSNIIEIGMIGVNSPNVKAIGYSEENVILALEYTDDKIYYYLDVPKKHFDNLTTDCPSVGSYLNRNIRGNYRYIRVK